MKTTLSYTKTTSDSDFWIALTEGDEKAFSILFKRHYARLVQYGNTLCAHSDKVQDSVQDVFTEVWLYRKKLNKDVVVKAYLISCVRKRLVRLQERDRIFKQLTPVDTLQFLFDYSIEHDLIVDQTQKDKVLYLNKLLNKLPERQKEALYLRYHQGLSVEQLAEVLNVNPQSASNLLHRAVLHLRKEWKGDLTSDMSFLLTFGFFIS